MAHEDGSRAYEAVATRPRCRRGKPEWSPFGTVVFCHGTKMDGCREDFRGEHGFRRVGGRPTKYFYDDESFRRIVNEPLLYGVAAWLIVAYLAFMMREDIGYEWRQLRRAVTEPKWSSNSGGDWPDNREGIVARIWSRMGQWNSVKNVQLQWANFRAQSSSRSSLKKFPNPESLRGSCLPALTAVQGKVSTAKRLANPLPSHPPKPSTQRRPIFPGSSPSNAAHSHSEPWDESEWID